jgi:hypothetical protein
VKRLIDESGLENTDKRLADLFLAAMPFEADPFQKRRVLVNLSRMKSPCAPHFWSRPLVVSALLVSGTAAAQLGHRYTVRGTGFLGFRPTVHGGAPNNKLEPHPTAVHPGVTPVWVDPTTVGPPFADGRPGEASTSGTRATAKSGAHARRDSSEDASCVVGAIQALRTERNP